jgi:hypothetical protein
MTNLIHIPFISNQQKGTLPNFIIIGGMKCATTSLHYYLNCHPQIFMSIEKELNFFIEEKNWNKGLDWYQSHFAGKAQIYGEASPNYTTYPYGTATPKLMYQTVPHAKLIYLVRDPIERIISHYVHRYADGGESRTITEALADFAENPYNSYVCRSRYYWQLEQYLQYFSADHILVISTEELANFPQETLTTIFNFLGISNYIDRIKYQKRLHKSVFKRRNTQLGNLIANFPIMTKIDNLPPSLRYHAKRLIYFPFSTAVKKPPLPKELKMELIDFLKEDIKKLRIHTGKNFDDWCL